MGKKMKLLQWPSCNHPKTLSYRFNSDDVIKTVNSVFFDQNDAATAAAVDTPESWFTNSSESASFSTDSDGLLEGSESLETVVAGARSERRLFVEPGGHTSSIVAAAEKPSISGQFSGANAGKFAGDRRKLGQGVALAMESEGPYGDFRRSMAEMVEVNGVRGWEGLEELLGWYLRMNGKDNHGFIVGAFVDLLVEIADSSGEDSTETVTVKAEAESFSSAVSRFSSPSERGRSEIDEEERNLTR